MKIKLSFFSLIPIILAFFLWGLYQWISPNYFRYDDQLNQLFCFAKFNWQTLIEHGSVPMINFYQFLGQNYLGQAQTGALYPPLYMATFFSQLFTGNFFWTIDYMVLFNMIMGSWGMYLLLTKLKVNKWLALLASTTWISFPFAIIISKSWFVIPHLIFVIPWNYLLLATFIKKKNFITAFLLGSFKAFAFYGGHPQFMFILCYSEFFFLVIFAFCHNFYSDLRSKQRRQHLSKKWLKYLIGYVFSYFVFVILSLPAILPIIKASQDSILRAYSLSVDNILTYSISLQQFFSSQFLSTENFVFFCSNIILFIGLPLLIPFGIFFCSNIPFYRKKIFIAVVSSQLFLFIICTKCYQIMLLFPLFEKFRWPFKHFIYFLFFFNVSVILVIDQLKQSKRKLAYRCSLVTMLTFLICYIVLNLYYGYGHRNTFRSSRISNNYQKPYAKEIDAHKGRIIVLGDKKWEKNFPADRTADSLLFCFASYWQYFYFHGYDPLLNRINFRCSLGSFLHSPMHITVMSIPLYFRSHAYLERWSGRYLITYNSPAILKKMSSKNWLKLLSQDSKFLLYENTQALPIVYLASQPRKHIRFQVIGNSMKIYTKTAKEDTLVITCPPLEGYYYKVNNEKSQKITPICEAQGYLKPQQIRIKIPPETKHIQLYYQDKLFFLGIYIAVSFLVLIFFYALVIFIKNRFRSH